MASKIDLISSALVLIGDKPINSLTTEGRAQQVANSLYDRIVANELSKHRWGFARAKAQLALTTETPIDEDFRSIYQLPSDMVALIKIRPNTLKYQIYGDKLYCNLNGKVTADYIYNAPESEWPEYFAQMIVYALALDFAASIRDSSSAKAELAQQYQIQSRMARYTDSQQHPQTPIVHRPFIDVRF